MLDICLLELMPFNFVNVFKKDLIQKRRRTDTETADGSRHRSRNLDKDVGRLTESRQKYKQTDRLTERQAEGKIDRQEDRAQNIFP